MQVICYQLLGFCFYFPEQLFDFRRLEIENWSGIPLYYEFIHCTIFRLKTINIIRILPDVYCFLTNNLHQEFSKIYIYIYLYIYKKLSPKWKKFHKQKVFCFWFYILSENFSKIGPIIKKIPKFQSDPLNLFI